MDLAIQSQVDLEQVQARHTLTQCANDICRRLMLEYGFIADPNLSTRHNAFICLGDMPIVDYWLCPTKMAFHDLTTSLTPLETSVHSWDKV
jgi:hypothetical protein